ncbi:MAG: UDP-3-O-(3-hydroxymyristoyl)glucosamine N-acyltransferase [Waddliaceae bacterium]|nr:UDP-3-O-(3-hydroxymyristoyl)glucosamine N-acyltransferase [Waddliaceae bacterium]MBT3579250.1 UDP-3-O-(3-hydroxymyristoyl)glucosamine N-acyltransferase [Waddliaceae bacterium]MBT4444768.1 UDP-3-O-(3-hydroxymyristoyl)glucosamine N-acyltransferase [Waddliaceae bacterium]MBT6929152.1 UDP-3-O-(3-hydroxymyristoyl)glucosamine N-acyltransferase [Waddliaceae bacterium]MBT7264707.1 UDP-3-O-(3-hydroxymyristoyl)glucosamine N-acyltransferase [Waddliaceae bacterium]
MIKLTLAEIAEVTACELVGDGSHAITSVADLSVATDSEASFLANASYSGAARDSSAGVIFIDKSADKFEGKRYLISDNPSLAFQKLLDILRPEEPSGFVGVHSTAVVHETATLGENVSLGPYVVIDKDAVIGVGTTIGSHCYIGIGTTLGEGCKLHPHASIRERCRLGDRVIVQQGAVIGSCGYGYDTGSDGKHTKLIQHGCVVIEDDVEVGANSTIDRARFEDTVICRGTKIDNLVQIAHGVHIGTDNLLVAQVGISGSVTTGKNVVLGGQAGVVGHLSIGDNIMVAARSVVFKSLKSPGKYGGIPAIPLREHQRQQVLLRNIKKLVERVSALETKS